MEHPVLSALMGSRHPSESIYLKTGYDSGNRVTDAFHQSVCVDVWTNDCCRKVKVVCFSFGIVGHSWHWFKTTWLGWQLGAAWIIPPGYSEEGEIYVHHDVGTITSQKTYGCKEEMRWYRWMATQRVYTRDVYSSFSFNCRRYAQQEYADAPGRH